MFKMRDIAKMSALQSEMGIIHSCKLPRVMGKLVLLISHLEMSSGL